jgi:hypothetical protein
MAPLAYTSATTIWSPQRGTFIESSYTNPR